MENCISSMVRNFPNWYLYLHFWWLKCRQGHRNPSLSRRPPIRKRQSLRACGYCLIFVEYCSKIAIMYKMQCGKWKKLASKCRQNFETFVSLFEWYYWDFKKAKSKVHRRDTTLRCGHYGAHAHNLIMAAMESCLDSQVTQRKIS